MAPQAQKTPTFEELIRDIHGGNDRFFFRRMLDSVQRHGGQYPHEAHALGITDIDSLKSLADAEQAHFGTVGDSENRSAAARAREQARKLIEEAEERERRQAAVELDYAGLSKRRADILNALNVRLPRRKARLEERRKRFTEEIDWAFGVKGRWLWLNENAEKLSGIEAALSRAPIVEKNLRDELADVEARMRAMEAGAPAPKRK